MRVMTYKALVFLALKYLGSYYRQYTMIFEKPESLLNDALTEAMPFFDHYSNCMFISINWAHVIPML